jgi:tetratricopeptide (TPR) repeat protein
MDKPIFETYMILNLPKKLLIFAFFQLILYNFGIAQDKPVNPKALELFIEGKTLELKDNYLRAIDKYIEALRIEEAPGIYFTLSKLYNYTSKYQQALDFGLKASKLVPDNLEYKENVADNYIMLNDYEKALVLYQEVSQKSPNDINILYNIGRLYETLKQPTQALKLYEKITEDFVYDQTVLRRMVAIYDGYKDYPNTASAMEKLLLLDPTNYELKTLLVDTYTRIPDYDNALKILENIVATNPKDQNAQKEIIKIYFKQNHPELAFEKYGQFINKDSVDFQTKIGIALAYFDAARDDSTMFSVAKSILETINKNYPKEWMPEFYLAVIEMRENNTKSAKQRLDKALTLADTSVEAYVQVGFVYFDQNDLKEAENIFTKGVQKFPEDFRLNYLVGLVHYRKAENKNAIPYLEKALTLVPNDLNVLSTLGIIYDNIFMDDDCERIYEQAFKYFPDNILLMNNYAYHLAERGKKLQEALAMSKKTIDKEPENSSYLDTYGWILFKLRDYKNALIYCEKANRIGSNAELLEHIGDIYEALEEIPKALRHWKLSLDKDPSRTNILQKIDKYQ